MRVGRHQLYVLGGGSVLFTTDLSGCWELVLTQGFKLREIV